MTAYQFRAPTWDDFHAVLDVLTAYGYDQVGRLLEGEDDLNARWRSSFVTLEDDARIFIDDQGRVAGYIDVLTPAPFVISYVEGFVHPDFHGQNLNTQLLEWAEERARQRIKDAPDGVRVAMRGEIIWCDEVALKAFKAQGFQVIRYTQEMVIHFDGTPPAPVFPENLTMRAFDPDVDGRMLAEVVEDVFRDHWGHVHRTPEEAYQRLQNHIKSAERVSENWFLAILNGEIVGFALCAPEVPEDPNIAWLLSLGVQRQVRRQGIGLGLLHYVFGEYFRRGKTGVILGVDTQSLTNAVRLYERAGMTPYQRFDEVEKELRPGRRMDTQ